MSLWRRWQLAAFLVGSTVGSTAAAEPGRRVTVDVAPQAQAAANISHTIVLERCRGGCAVIKASNNAQGMMSTIPQGTGPFTVGEFQNANGETGAAADAEWNALVACVRQVYSSFDVNVTDAKPSGMTYHLALVAGVPAQLGLPNDILGIAPLAGDCSPQDNVISFSFANAHIGGDRTNNLCWTISQESAHAFGLDHEYKFADGKSTCIDPMTYQMDCGGQRFFRNKLAQCGEFNGRPCKCTQNQNSYQRMMNIFGPGQTLVAPPTVTITFPQPGATTLMSVVGASAGSQRGIAKVELLVNGFVWASTSGLPVGQNGQMTPGNYTLNVPATLPKSIVDIVVRASDDLGVSTDSAPMTLTNGAPCTSEAVCAAHQKCEDGRCRWSEPVGELGESCEYPQFCKSGMCVDTSAGKFCSEPCVPESDPETCPMDLVCVQSSPGEGLCLPTGDTGCCSTGRGSSPYPFAGLALATFGWIMRRRARFAGVRDPRAKRDENC